MAAPPCPLPPCSKCGHKLCGAFHYVDPSAMSGWEMVCAGETCECLQCTSARRMPRRLDWAGCCKCKKMSKDCDCCENTRNPSRHYGWTAADVADMQAVAAEKAERAAREEVEKREAELMERLARERYKEEQATAAAAKAARIAGADAGPCTAPACAKCGHHLCGAYHYVDPSAMSGWEMVCAGETCKCTQCVRAREAPRRLDWAGCCKCTAIAKGCDCCH